MHLISPASLFVPLQFGGQSRAELFQRIYLVFLVLGTLVGVVVIGYTLYNAYRYRDGGDADDGKGTGDRPQLGELPASSGGGKKLFVSFGISAVIVIGLILWTYTALLYVEAQPAQAGDDTTEIEVTGQDIAWTFEYENGVTTRNELRVPANERVLLYVTSGDVWHTFGIPDKRVKADAIPGETSETWFDTGEPGEYRAECFELCGEGHSGMEATVIVMPADEYEQWLAEQAEESDDSENGDGESGDGESAERLAPLATAGAAPAGQPAAVAVTGGGNA